MQTEHHLSNAGLSAPRFAIGENVARTMSSREIANVTGKRHANVKRDILAMLKELKADALSFEHIYLDGQNREQAEYLLDREHTDCLLTGYSALLRMKVIRRWHELEQRDTGRQSAIANGTKVVGELAIMECYTRLLKPAPSSQMMMLAKISQNNGLDATFLPAYAIDAASDSTGGSSMPTKALTALLRDNSIKMSAPAFNVLLGAAGYLKRLTRKSSKQETVEFWSVTDLGLRFGKNLTSPNNPRETQPHWYVERFAELAREVRA